MESVSSINKDMCGAKLLPATVSTYPVDCVCFCHLRIEDTALHACVLMKGITCLWLPTLPFAYYSIHATRDITVVVNKVAQNPAVLAS